MQRLYEDSNVYLPILLFVSCYLGMIFLSQHLDRSDYKTNFLRLLKPSLLLAVILNYPRNGSYFNKQFLFSAIFVGLVIAFTYPAFYHATHHGEPEGYSFAVDFPYGIFVVSLLISLRNVLSCYLSSTAFAVIFTVTEFVFLLPVFFQLAYFVYYRECINEMAVKVLLDTNILEAKEFIRLIPLAVKVLSAVILLFVLALLFQINVNTYTEVPLNPFLGIISVVLLFLLFGNKKRAVFRRTGLISLYFQVKDYKEKLKNSFLAEPDFPENLIIDSPLTKRKFGTVMLVIGESANRLHMKAFSEYGRETTPWLSEQAKTKNFFLFPNSYSSWIQTPEAVKMALTNKNQYNKAEQSDEISIINIANKLGFKTWWFSAQGYSAEKSTDVTVIANAAKEKRWLMQDYSVRQYDEKLLEYIKKMDNKQNNFLVVHLEGSHAEFLQRYPAAFENWPVKKNDALGSDPYDNSILYTDFILQELFNFAKEHLGLQAMVYFSDHGSLIGKKRKSSFSGFEDTRIPFFVYLSDKYQEEFPDTARTLHSHQKSYFTNDLIFDFLLGILQIDHSLHKTQNDISSPAYQFTRETLRTNLGKTSLADDKWE